MTSRVPRSRLSGALRTNRIIYPNQIRQQAKAFAPAIRKDDPNVSFVTVGNRRFYAYRYEGKVSDCEKAVVLLCYSEKSLGNPDALRVFISTQTNLSTQEILEMYAKRWSIEVFFRNCKQKLAFDKCQLREAARHRKNVAASFACAFPLLHASGL